MHVLLRQMKRQRRTMILFRGTLFGKRARWRTVKWRFISPRTTRRTSVQGVCQNANPTVQFVINAAKLTIAFKVICRETKPRQHD